MNGNHTIKTTPLVSKLLVLIAMLYGSTLMAAERQCLDCHAGQAPVDNLLHSVHGRLASTGMGAMQACQSCHGASQAHRNNPAQHPVDMTFKADEPAEAIIKVCETCHTGGSQQQWHASEHALADVACTSCHDIHSAKDRVSIRGEQQEVCFSCHKDKRIDQLRFSRHPIAEGVVSCSDCHNTHGGKGPSMLLESTVNETCYRCHAEKRGPFLFEHEPVQDDCTNCHTPHGSVNDNMLVARQPLLCQQCHIASRHPGQNRIRDTQLNPSGGGPGDLRLIGKSCLNCHGQVHGTNHPAGMTFRN